MALSKSFFGPPSLFGQDDRGTLVSFFFLRLHKPRLCFVIADRGKWLRSQANIKGVIKNANIYVGRSSTVHSLLFFALTLCIYMCLGSRKTREERKIWLKVTSMSYAIKTFLRLVPRSVIKQLFSFVKRLPRCNNLSLGFVHSQGQNRRHVQNHIQQRTLSSFISIPPLPTANYLY